MPTRRRAAAAGDSHVVCGLEAFDNKDYQHAIAELERAIQLGIEHYDLPEIHTILGRTYKNLGRYQEAIKAHRKAIEIEPAFHKAWNNLGMAYLETNRFEEAVQCFEKAVDLNPEYSFAQASLAATYIHRNKPKQAIEHLRKAVSLNPNLSEAHGNLALAYAMIGKFQDAEQSLKQATALGYENWQDVRKRITALQQMDSPQIAMDRPDIQDIIAALAGESIEEREAAAKSLRDLAKRGISTEEGLLALRAATHEFPPRRYNFLDSSADLIRAAAEQPQPEYIPVVAEFYFTYSQRAKEAALALLARSEERAAAVAYMKILRLYARRDGVPTLHVAPLITHPRHADVFLPEILDYADIPPLAFDVYLLCLTYLQQDLVGAKNLLPYADQIVDHYQTHEGVLFAQQQSEGISWMWEDTYQKSRNMGALLLDLMGYLDTPGVENALARALTYQDPRLKCFAIGSLLRIGKDVESSHLLGVARSAEMRRALYQQLDGLDALLLFPEEFRTQAALAESDMVHWLIYPTELGRAPDEIELMEVVGFDTKAEKGCVDYYVFRFRTHEPHWAAEEGWVAGVSGPFPHQNALTVLAPGSTFSAFESWDSKTPEEHVRSVCRVLDESET